MMLGIQKAVSSISLNKNFIINNHHFSIKNEFEIETIHQEKLFKFCKFYDYAPSIFYEIRRIFGISTEDYLNSIGPQNIFSSILKGNLDLLNELVSSGKSGSFFYYSADGKNLFLIEIFKKILEIIKNF